MAKALLVLGVCLAAATLVPTAHAQFGIPIPMMPGMGLGRQPVQTQQAQPVQQVQQGPGLRLGPIVLGNPPVTTTTPVATTPVATTPVATPSTAAPPAVRNGPAGAPAGPAPVAGSYALTNGLPECKVSNVLRPSSGLFPTNWGRLTAEQQAAHPINLAIFQLNYAVYRDPVTILSKCLNGLGVDTGSMKQIDRQVAELNSGVTSVVLKAGNEAVFVVLKGSDADNAVLDAACRYTEPLGRKFNAPGTDLRLHYGFWRGWEVMEQEIVSTVQTYLRQVSSKKVYIVGHSLGAAMASIAALRLNTVIPKSSGEIAGVWLLASPRTGNTVFKDVYHKSGLLPKTLRMSNYKDFTTRLPGASQECSISGGGTLTQIATERGKFSFAHVGRSLLMCPTADGMTSWTIAPGGSNVVDCNGNDGSDLTTATHLLGAYFDAWRRGYTAKYGNNLANDKRLQAVLCAECAFKKITRIMQVNAPCRPDGPVTCGNDANCRNRRAWEAATSLNGGIIHPYDPNSQCQQHLCTDRNGGILGSGGGGPLTRVTELFGASG